jgi:hypothetical protein
MRVTQLHGCAETFAALPRSLLSPLGYMWSPDRSNHSPDVQHSVKRNIFGTVSVSARGRSASTFRTVPPSMDRSVQHAAVMKQPPPQPPSGDHDSHEQNPLKLQPRRIDIVVRPALATITNTVKSAESLDTRVHHRTSCNVQRNGRTMPHKKVSKLQERCCVMLPDISAQASDDAQHDDPCVQSGSTLHTRDCCATDPIQEPITADSAEAWCLFVQSNIIQVC